jgi:hypothetical protein
VTGRGRDDAEIADDRDAAQAGQVLRLPRSRPRRPCRCPARARACAGPSRARPVRPGRRSLLVLPRPGEELFAGWMPTLRPAAPEVVCAGTRTVLPGSDGIATPTGVGQLPGGARPRVNWSLARRPPVLRTRRASQEITRSGPRSRASRVVSGALALAAVIPRRTSLVARSRSACRLQPPDSAGRDLRPGTSRGAGDCEIRVRRRLETCRALRRSCAHDGAGTRRSEHRATSG